MRLNAEIKGVADVYEVLGNVAPRDAVNIMRATVGGMAAEIRKDARTGAPKDQGDLKKAIKVKRRKVRGGLVTADIIVERRAFYWRFVEYGTSRLSPNGFFLRALERFRAHSLRLFSEQFVKKFEAALARKRKAGHGR